MKYWPFMFAMAASVVGFSGCTQTPTPVKVPEAAHIFSIEAITDPVVIASAEDAKALCDLNLNHVNRLRNEIRAISGKHDRENTLERLNEMDIAFERIFGMSELMANTHPDENVRKEAEDCYSRADEVMNDVSTDPQIYAALSDVDATALDDSAKRFVDKTLLAYKLAGVDKDDATRAKLSELNKTIIKMGQEFDKNIRDDRKTAKFTAEQLKGLPEDYFKSHVADENGLITVSTDYTDYVPVITYAESEATRAEMTKLFNSRAYPANNDAFKALLAARYEYAKLIGFDNWVDYNAYDKMAKDGKTIQEFIANIAAMTSERSKAEIAELMELKKADNPNADGFYAWDRFYYTEKLKQQKFNFDSQTVRQYFPYEQVKRGILNVASSIYGITFQQSDRPVWHDSVEAYDVYLGDERIASFYLDMHPREGKYGHAAMFPLYGGVEGLQLPAGSLVCNFPEPTPNDPALMAHDDVVTFFHEFGHLMNQLLSGHHHWVNQSGTSSEWDFVEVPSQLFENWAWDYDVIKRFAVNDKGEVIDKDTVDKMKKADDVGKGMFNMRQISYAALSYNYHNADPSGMDLLTKQNEIFAQYSPFSAYEGDYTFASFGHLNGYSSQYYTYMWSLSIVRDLEQVFKQGGFLNTELTHKYRDNILAVGGAIDASEMVKNFLGREYTLDAFKKWLAE